MGRVQELDLPEPADCALLAVGGDHQPAEPPLMEPHASSPQEIPSLQRIVRADDHGVRTGFVEISDRQANPTRPRVVCRHEHGVDGLVPAGPYAHEVGDRHLELERGSKRAVVRLIDVPRSIGVEEPEVVLLVVVRRSPRGLERERGRACCAAAR